MKIQRQGQSSRRGAALITSLILVAGIASMGAGLIQISSVSTRRQNQGIDTIQALYVAEAALSEAYFAVAQGKQGNIGSETEPAQLGGGYYWVEAVDLPNGLVMLEATGLHGRGKFALSMALNRSVNHVAALGICGLDGVNVGEGADLRTSATPNGPATSLVDPPSVNLRSNGDITVYSPITLDPEQATNVIGNITPGPNGLADLDPSTVVTGSTSASARGLTLPTFTIPKMDLESTPFEYASGQTKITLNSDTAWQDVVVPPGLTLTLEGPMRLRVENIHVGDGARVIMDTTNGPIGLYTTGSAVFSNGSILENVGGDATQCSIFALTPDETKRSLVSMGAKGEFKGMIVAPRSHVEIPGDLQVTGSVVSETLAIGDNATVRFDENLLNGGYGVKMVPTLVSWEVIEVPDTPLTQGNHPVDAKITTLGYTPVPTASSHREKNVQVHYVDLLGAAKVYDGVATGVPWGDVKMLDHLKWYDGAILEPAVRPSIVVDTVDDLNGIVDIVVKPLG